MTAREDQPGGKRLAAYLVADGTAAPADLAAWLGERLPAYMVPAAFVVLAALPRTPNGKVDRNALPSPAAAVSAAGDELVAPETPEERSLAAIWCEVLGADRVGIHDDFFRLGGHSLLAAQVIARMRRDFQVDLPLRSLFQTPTIAGLLAAVHRARANAEPLAVPPIERVSRAAAARPRPSPPGGRGRP